MNTLLKKIQKNSERGQAIILIAFSIVGLVAIVGLMIDGGILLIEYARLKRAIDSASIAAASQFRKGYVVADLENAGTEFLNFNQTKPDDVTVFTCETDESLCAAATGGVARKLVRVTASRRVDFGFIRVIGIDSTTISATSIGEAASIDMVLVIDTSSSMAYDTTDYTPGDGRDNDSAISASQPGDDPAICNSHLPGLPATPTRPPDGRCEPLGTIMDVAVKFVETNLLFYPYDRVAIVASTEQSAGGQRNRQLVLPFSDNQDDDGHANEEIQTAIRGLRVFQPVVCSDDPLSPSHTISLGGCVRRFPDGTYETIGCDRNDATLGPSTCGASNIGGSLYKAGEQFNFARQESFWAVVALIGGPANATNPIPGKDEGFCPGLVVGCRDKDTVSLNDGFNPLTFDWREDPPGDVTRHPTGGILDPDYGFDPDNPVFPAEYDADDYARDAADFVTSRSIGQGATLYSICLGTLCQSADPARADPHSGDHLGRYMAEYSGGTNANHGVYYLAPDADQLADIFLQIGNNIFTRISQ